MAKYTVWKLPVIKEIYISEIKGSCKTIKHAKHM